MTSLSVIIPQFGSSDLTLQCVRSLLSFHDDVDCVIIIDDGSPQHDVAALQLPQLKRTEILRFGSNSGITACWNLATRFATSETLIFLNNDTLTTGSWCGKLIQPLQDRNRMMSGTLPRSAKELPFGIRKQLGINSLLSGWCFAIRRSDLLKLGGFDASLRLYFSDTDLQCRIAQKVGADSLVAVDDLAVAHHAHQTTQKLSTRREQWRADQSRFLQKWKRSGGTEKFQ